jgi:hypothetical protein
MILLLWLPVTVPHLETSFRKRRKIKNNYTSKSTGQTRPNNFVILNIKNKEAAKIEMQQLITDFAKSRARAMAFF